MRKEPILNSLITALLFLAACSLILPACAHAGSTGSPSPDELNIKPLEELRQAPRAENLGLDRFEIVYEGTAVRDKETGLVWEQSPEPTMMTWADAVTHCDSLEPRGRTRWHLATLDELSGLVDSSVLGSPKLPSAHPFDTGCRLGGCVQSDTYWSSTPFTESDSHVWLVCFCNGSVTRSDKSFDNFAWCAQSESAEGTN